MTGTRQWNTGIVARNRIYFGADHKTYTFKLPTADADANAYRYCHCDCNPDSHLHSRSKPYTDSYSYSYCYTNPGPDRPHCAWLQGAGPTRGGSLMERSGRANVDIYRNDQFIVTTGNDGFHTDSPGNRGHARTGTKYAMRAPKLVLVR